MGQYLNNARGVSICPFTGSKVAAMEGVEVLTMAARCDSNDASNRGQNIVIAMRIRRDARQDGLWKGPIGSQSPAWI